MGAWLSIMEVDVHDTEQLFKILDDGDGQVSPDEFVGGILRLKGHARSQDVIRIMHSCHKLVHDVAAMNENLSSIGESFNKCEALMVRQADRLNSCSSSCSRLQPIAVAKGNL